MGWGKEREWKKNGTRDVATHPLCSAARGGLAAAPRGEAGARAGPTRGKRGRTGKTEALRRVTMLHERGWESVRGAGEPRALFCLRFGWISVRCMCAFLDGECFFWIFWKVQGCRWVSVFHTLRRFFGEIRAEWDFISMGCRREVKNWEGLLEKKY